MELFSLTICANSLSYGIIFCFLCYCDWDFLPLKQQDSKTY